MDVTKKLTIVIPVRIDCEERKENLDAIIHSLLMTTESQIVILEADIIRKYYNHNIDNHTKLKYVFTEDSDPIFHRTYYLNQLLRMSQTDIVGIWDTDVFLTNEQLKLGIQEIISGVTLCYPFDGRFLFLDINKSDIARKDILSFINDKNNENIPAVLGRPSVGGAFIVNKLKYLKAGGENESFYGWGPEDAERYKRIEILEEKISRVPGFLYHLYHPRGMNSSFSYDGRDESNVKEFLKICRMDKTQLLEYIDGWIK